MPRISHNLIRSASRQHPHLPELLRACRDINGARLELKWLKEHIDAKKAWSLHQRQERLRDLCRARKRGVPLQYLLGSEYFGSLEIKCRPGVLIPRQATAEAVSKLLELLRLGGTNLPPTLRVLDLCSGTGCISLLFAHSFPYRETAVRSVEICAVDISPTAIRLAQKNRRRILRSLNEPESYHNPSVGKTIRKLKFLLGDIFTSLGSTSPTLRKQSDDTLDHSSWDIIISNPPYISPKSFRSVTTRSVRNYEPEIALVPQPRIKMEDEQHGDLFYPRLLQLADIFNTKLVLLEVGDMFQAQRVANLAKSYKRWAGVEIWRDNPREDAVCSDQKQGGLSDINIVGDGDGRSVICWTADASSWIGKNATGRKS